MNCLIKPLYEVKNLSFSYHIGDLKVDVLKDVSIELSKNELICFSGPSGSGKSTLLNILGLIENVQTGSVVFNEQNFSSMSENKKNQIRRFQIGFVFQKFHLLPVLTAEENVEYFLQRQGLSSKERKMRVHEALDQVQLYELRHKKPFEMSGGQQQRVAIARALAKEPLVIIADEPTASLDQKNAKDLIELLNKLSRDKSLSVIMASHDPLVHSYVDKHYQVVHGSVTCI